MKNTRLIIPVLTFALGYMLGAWLHFEPTVIVRQPTPIVFAPKPKAPEPPIFIFEQKHDHEDKKPAIPGMCEVCGTEHTDTEPLTWEQWSAHAGLSAYQRSAFGVDDSKSMPADVAAGMVEEKPTWTRTRFQGVMLGRMFASEDGRAMRLKKGGGTCGELTDDHMLIARVVMNNAEARSDFKGWADVMRFLSPHVGKVKEPKKKRQEWTSTLPAIGDDMPSGWIDSRSVEDPEEDYNHGDWRVHGPCWVQLRKNAIALWLKGPPFGRFGRDVKPSRWGNNDDVIRFFSATNKHGNLTKEAIARRDRWCVVPHGDLNFFIAKNGRGCTVGDETTVAAYEGLKPERVAANEEQSKKPDADPG